jgi:5'-phosphate synthase pdxT subunit
MILLARGGALEQIDVAVERNAYGRQVASFEADLELEDEVVPLRGVFIRAPRVREVGPGVDVLAEHEGEPVLLREDRFLVASFHPELTEDARVHERFLAMVREGAHVRT